MNLSGQNKNWCTTEVIQSYELTSEKEVIEINEEENGSLKAEIFGHSKWHDFYKYNEEDYAIYYSAPISKNTDNEALICAFYLYKNGKFIEKKGYSKSNAGVFKITPGKAVYEIVCFVKNKEILPIRIKSSKIYVR